MKLIHIPQMQVFIDVSKMLNHLEIINHSIISSIQSSCLGSKINRIIFERLMSYCSHLEHIPVLLLLRRKCPNRRGTNNGCHHELDYDRNPRCGLAAALTLVHISISRPFAHIAGPIFQVIPRRVLADQQGVILGIWVDVCCCAMYGQRVDHVDHAEQCSQQYHRAEVKRIKMKWPLSLISLVCDLRRQRRTFAEHNLPAFYDHLRSRS